MSIETDLGRIATALEAMVKIQEKAYGLATADKQPAPAVVVPTAKKASAAKAAPAAAPAEPEVDPFNQEAAAEEVSFETLSALLKQHSVKLGVKTTIALILKHGADKVTPKLNTIPTANFKACFDEATADLKKLEVKK